MISTALSISTLGKGSKLRMLGRLPHESNILLIVKVCVAYIYVQYNHSEKEKIKGLSKSIVLIKC